MPAAEAEVVAEEQNSYELAFHVLPTVAEGEVSDVFTAIKTHITELGGALFAEEAPQRVDLAYDIIQNTEGKNRHFTSAYFGWVRATLPSEAVAALTEYMDGNEHILRHLLIKLTKLEIEHPVYFHEIMAELDEKVSTVDDGEVTATVAPETTEAATTEAAAEAAPATAETETETEVEAAPASATAEADTTDAAEADTTIDDTAEDESTKSA